jgi:uncharacterized protein (TIGR02118 family)
MARLVAIYATPPDPAAFDAHYAETHLPLAKKIPGLQRFNLSIGPIFTPAGPSAFHAIATLTFADMPTLLAALSSPEGQAAAAQAQTIMAPGSQILLFDTTEL